jgi:hypothetical protein
MFYFLCLNLQKLVSFIEFVWVMFIFNLLRLIDYFESHTKILL